MQIIYPPHLDPNNLHDLSHRINSPLPINALHNLQTNYTPHLHIHHQQVFIHTELFVGITDSLLKEATDLPPTNSKPKVYQQHILRLLNSLLKMRQLLTNQLTQLNSRIKHLETKLNPTTKSHLQYLTNSTQLQVTNKQLKKEIRQLETKHRTNSIRKETKKHSTNKIDTKLQKKIDNFFKPLNPDNT